MDLDTQQLSNAAREDPGAAVVLLIELHYERIYTFLRRLCGNDTDAADLTQRTFGRVQQALASFGGRSSIASWIHGIAYHLYVDWRRANGRTEARPDAWWASCASTEPSPDERLVRTDLARRLYACVDALEPGLRQTVHLHYYQGLTLQETADAMDVAASTVKYRLRQALAQLQRQFATDRNPAAGTSPRPATL